jgi:YebC/PmpR family DNA-binding regulatory protein
MSGHSKWSKIKRQKGTADQRRGRLFSKIAKLISVSARSGGDPEANPRLASAVAKAKEINMTKDTIEKAIKKGTGEDELGGQFEEFTLEAVGTGGVGILIECTSDNKNRTLSEIKKLLESHLLKSAWN